MTAREQQELAKKALDEHYDSCERCSKAYNEWEMCDKGKQLEEEYDGFLDSLERD